MVGKIQSMDFKIYLLGQELTSGEVRLITGEIVTYKNPTILLGKLMCLHPKSAKALIKTSSQKDIIFPFVGFLNSPIYTIPLLIRRITDNVTCTQSTT